MNTIKYLKYLAVSLLLVVGFTSCSDDDNLGDAPRLFRPIAKLTQDGTRNNLKATWTRLGGATGYQYELYQLVTDSTVITDGLQPIDSDIIDNTEIMFEGLSWDERYILKVRSVGSNIESSQYYETEYTTLSYPTALNTVRTIDNAALVTWTDPTARGQQPYTRFVVTAEDGTILEYDVTDEDNSVLKKTIEGLTPETTYTLRAYYGDEQTVDTYEGRQVFTTRAVEDYDAEYGSNWIDLRDMDIDTLDDLMNMINDGAAVILKGGAEYEITSAFTQINKSFILRTGLSLEGNAVVVSSAAMNAADGATISKMHFVEIDFISDLVKNTGFDATTTVEFMQQESAVSTMSGRQVININNATARINEIIFEDCSFTYYRAVLRLQAGGASGDFSEVNSVTFTGCTLDGIGDQGIVTTDNKANSFSNVTIQDCTLTNIVVLSDVRTNGVGNCNIDITDCTFCYASNSTTQMLRLGNNGIVNIQNSVFGPGWADAYYQAAATAYFQSGGVVSASNSYKTNFSYTDATTAYAIEDLNSLSGNETAVFEDPANANFTLIDSSISRSVGATKWRAE
ncbi:MAG: hypothetical protein LUF85_07720 [Bacteroides sp.]|nr:hypothetical protein [Bacteroides sp.]